MIIYLQHTLILSLKWLPKSLQYKSWQTNPDMDIYNQLEQKARSNYLEPDLNATMRQVHLQQKNEQNYKDTILQVFNYGLASRNYEQHLKIGLWFAEIYNLDPHYSHHFPSLRLQFFSAAIENIIHHGAKLEGLPVLVARLIEFDQVAEIVRDLKQLAAEANEHSKKILATLVFLNEVMVWQIQRKKIYVRGRRYQALKMIKNVLKELKQMPELNQQKFVGEKIKLLHSIILYLHSQHRQKSQDVSEQILSFKARIVEELTMYERIQLDRDEQDMYLDLLTETIRLFGIYDQTKIETLVTKYKHKTESTSYLEFFKILAEHATRKTTVTIKQTMQYIVQNLLSKIFEVEFKTFSQLYNVLKAKSDIIIELNKVTLVNLTRYLQKCLQRAYINYQQMFFNSLIIIYNPTVRSEVTSKLNPVQQSIFYHNKQQKQYYEMIEYFASADFKVTDFIQDPESRDALVWGLLALRNSIKVNYYFLSEKKYVFSIYTNLVTLMLGNVCSKQCQELASELLYKTYSSVDIWKSAINYTSIIAWSHQNLQFVYAEALQSFSRLLRNHAKVFKKQPFQNLDIFTQICHLGTKILLEITSEQQQLQTRYVQAIFALLRITIPTHNIQLIKTDDIYAAAQGVFGLIQACPNNALFPIYIDFIFTFRQNDILAELVEDTRVKNHEMLNNIDMLIYRKYESMKQISKRSDLSQDDVQLFWQKVNYGIDLRYTDLGLYFLQFYRHLLNNFKNQIQMNPDSARNFCLFYRNQVMECHEALNSIYKKIEEQNLVASLQNLLEISVSLNFNLTIILTEIQKNEQMKIAAEDKLVRLCQDISRWLKIMQKLFNDELKLEQKGMALSLWQVSYITLIVVACLACELCRRSELDINFSYEVMRAKLEWATKKLRQMKEQKVQRLNLVFTQLFLFQLQAK